MDARRASILGAKVRPPCGPTSRYHPVSRAPRDARLMWSQRTGAMTRPGHGGQSAEPTQSASHPFGRRLRGDLRRRRRGACTILRSLATRTGPTTRPLQCLCDHRRLPVVGATPQNEESGNGAILTPLAIANHRRRDRKARRLAWYSLSRAAPELDPLPRRDGLRLTRIAVIARRNCGLRPYRAARCLSHAVPERTTGRGHGERGQPRPELQEPHRRLSG